MRTADQVIERIKRAIGLDKDADLSKHFGIPKTTISGWRGRNAVPYELCVQVAMKHGASLDWLLTGEGSPWRLAEGPPAGGGYQVWLSPGEEEVLMLYRALDTDAQREIQAVAEEKKRLREIERQLKELQATVDATKRSA